MVSSSWKRVPLRAERPAYRRKPKLGAGVGEGREPSEAALGTSTWLSRVADTTSRMTIEWEVKREKKGSMPVLAIEVCILVLETQFLALDQRVAQNPIKGSSSISADGGKSPGISMRSSLFQQVNRWMSCVFGPNYNHKATNCQIGVSGRRLQKLLLTFQGVLLGFRDGL